MNCASCGTRINSGQRNCPACGRTVSSQSGTRSGGSETSPSARGLSPSSAKAPDPRDGLRDVSSSRPASSQRKQKSKASKSSKRAKPPTEVSLDKEVKEEAEATGEPGGLSTAALREMVHDRPDCLEPGLSIYTSGDANPVGVDFETDVGHIDLLARDDAGGLVAVLIAMDPEDVTSGKELVSAALERVGWVRKHVAEPEQEVRAIVLLDQVPEDTSYAAAAVASTVSFKTCRVEVRFDEVDL